MHIIMMAFVVFTVSQPQLPFEDDNEWVAEGWEIIRMETYDIADYVEPYSVIDRTEDYFVDFSISEKGSLAVLIGGKMQTRLIYENKELDISELTSTSPLLVLNLAYYFLNSIETDPEMNNFWELVGSISSIRDAGVQLTIATNCDGILVGISGFCAIVFDESENASILFDYFDHTMQRISNWGIARNGNLLVLARYRENCLSAYDMSGNHLWNYSLDLSGGTMPMKISDNGEVVGATATRNGYVLLNRDGQLISHVLDDPSKWQVESSALSPNGRFAALTASPLSTDTMAETQLFLVDIRTCAVSQINLNGFATSLTPNVVDISQNGYILCGLFERENSNDRSESLYGTIVLDPSGELVWASDRSETTSSLIDTSTPVLPMMSIYDAAYGYNGTIRSSNNSISLAYLDINNGYISAIYLEAR